ncbi:MAG: response regulator [Candidatus Riflebacteria bacterium]|nr:response regulator [Candidatus Riflebacteria bacterium]
MSYNIPILVVDDSELALEMGKDVLEECGYGVLTTADPTAVVDLLRSSAVEIVLLDMMMPVKNGLEVMQDIRAAEPELGRHIMIFVITGMSDRQTALAALRGGAYFYMTKPLRRETLLPSLQTCIAQLEQARDPSTLDTSRALRERISQACTSDSSEVQLRQPETPNAYPNPILLVGGDEKGSGAMSTSLLVHGYHVLDCPKVDQTLLLFARHPVDVILLTCRLPLEGLTKLVDQLRSAALAVRRRVSIFPVLDADRETWGRALTSQGATMCLKRPMDEAALLGAVDWAARRALGR